jgi:hypothetical protein
MAELGLRRARLSVIATPLPEKFELGLRALIDLLKAPT